MKVLTQLTVALLLLGAWACDKEDAQPDTNEDYLIFGHAYGMCFGEECIETFKLTDEQLFEDTSDSYLTEDFDFVPLSQDLFERVRDLRQEVPDALLSADATTFGCPDCADQGSIRVELEVDGEVKTWTIDQDKNAIPEYLHDFIDEVNAKIQLINE